MDTKSRVCGDKPSESILGAQGKERIVRAFL
jgi:hypothetical protein